MIVVSYLCFRCGAHYDLSAFTNHKAGLTNWCNKCKKRGVGNGIQKRFNDTKND